MTYYIGILSGTSMDAIDAAIIDFDVHPPRIVATHSRPYSSALKIDIQALIQGCEN